MPTTVCEQPNEEAWHEKTLVLGGRYRRNDAIVNKLRRSLAAAEWRITIVALRTTRIGTNRDTCSCYSAPFTPLDQVTRSRHTFLPEAVDFVVGQVDLIDADARTVALAGGKLLPDHYLVIATGVTPRPDQTPGALGAQWRTSIGRFVVHTTDLPIKCPVAPLEFTFLADEYFRRRGFVIGSR